MTTSVKIQVHCSDDKEVKVTIVGYYGKPNKRVIRLQDGETYEGVIHDRNSVACEEVMKGDDSE